MALSCLSARGLGFMPSGLKPKPAPLGSDFYSIVYFLKCDSDISVLETGIGHALPEAYRGFLAEYNSVLASPSDFESFWYYNDGLTDCDDPDCADDRDCET